MKQTFLSAFRNNTRFRLTLLGMSLVTLFAWRAGWKEGMFATFCTAITSLALAYITPHVYESVKNNPKPPDEQ